MNILADPLPDAINIGGKEYQIHTDARDWIRFDRLLRDGEIDMDMKARIMLTYYDGALPDDLSEALKRLIDFFQPDFSVRKAGGGDAGRTPARVLDFDLDAVYIYAAFRQAYALDLCEVEYLHWWQFLALLDGLPDNTRLSEIMRIRAADTSKMDKNEKQRYDRLKKLYALQPVKARPMTQRERDEEYLRREKKRADEIRAKMGEMPTLPADTEG